MFDQIKNAVSNAGDLGEMGDLKQYVDGIDFPANKDEIISHLQESGAQEDLIAKLRDVGQEHFSGPTDLITSFLGKR